MSGAFCPSPEHSMIPSLSHHTYCTIGGRLLKCCRGKAWKVESKQPGHESNGCPHPRTTETKQCYHCQGLGHVQADCPTLRLSGAGTSGRCYSCGIAGHLARNCPNPGMGRASFRQISRIHESSTV
ncbi:hypothetical protein GGP41_008488 [Bipolaris sorokiniana]|uniref:CCHC-type domain-containing protein n=1 Tax=Cochliobolus sativus TaxID=45130 RepID=A0A8H6DS38_COCSA|nr:hypothetical protein GGP41_008488 [Bipolaris sorokiniana]